MSHLTLISLRQYYIFEKKKLKALCSIETISSVLNGAVTSEVIKKLSTSLPFVFCSLIKG